MDLKSAGFLGFKETATCHYETQFIPSFFIVGHILEALGPLLHIGLSYTLTFTQEC